MKKLTKTVLFILIIMAILVPTKLQADSFTLNVTADKQYVEPGQAVVLSLGVADIDAGDLGINTLEAKLEYDTDIFEEVEQADINSANNWSLTYNNQETADKGKILAVIVQSGVTEDQNIGTITLKVKNGVEYTSTTIKLTGIQSNNGVNLIETSDKQVVLEVGTKVQEPAGNDKGNNGNESQTPGNGTTTGGNKKPTSSLPHAGVTNGIIIVGTVALISFAVVMFVKYRNIDK